MLKLVKLHHNSKIKQDHLITANGNSDIQFNYEQNIYSICCLG